MCRCRPAPTMRRAQAGGRWSPRTWRSSRLSSSSCSAAPTVSRAIRSPTCASRRRSTGGRRASWPCWPTRSVTGGYSPWGVAATTAPTSPRPGQRWSKTLGSALQAAPASGRDPSAPASRRNKGGCGILPVQFAPPFSGCGGGARMFRTTMSIEGFDPELARAIQNERHRQEDHVELIASENYASPRVLEAQGSVLTNKYAEGYPGTSYYGGCEYVDIVEQLAIDRARQLFGADFANVQPHSGSQANAAAYLALVQPGDAILGMSLDHGGHLTHGAKVNFSGKFFRAAQYGIRPDTGEIDYEQVQRLAEEHPPQMIISRFSGYSRIRRWARLAN